MGVKKMDDFRFDFEEKNVKERKVIWVVEGQKLIFDSMRGLRSFKFYNPAVKSKRVSISEKSCYGRRGFKIATWISPEQGLKNKKTGVK
jgi:hypothetical protein